MLNFFRILLPAFALVLLLTVPGLTYETPQACYDAEDLIRNQIYDISRIDQLYTQCLEGNLSPSERVNTYVNRGFLRRVNLDYSKAIADYTKAISIDPKYAEAYAQRAFTYRNKRDVAKAIADAKKARELDPTISIPEFELPQVCKDANELQHKTKKPDLSRVIQLYNQCLGNSLYPPDRSLIYFNRGDARLVKGDIDGAIADFTEAISLDPKATRAYFYRAISREEIGDLDGAIQDCNKLLSLAPEYTLAYSFRAFAYKNIGEITKAKADAKKARELDPKAYVPTFE